MSTNSANPHASLGSNIVVQVPVTIKLVDALSFNQFKLWGAISNVLSNVTVGFWVWFGQNEKADLCPFLKWVAIVSTLLTLIALSVAWFQNSKMYKDSRDISYSPDGN